MVAVLRAHPNPPQAAQAPREPEAAVRNLASVPAVIALDCPNPGYGMFVKKETCGLNRKTLRMGREK